MKAKNVIEHDELKIRMLTIRLNEKQEHFIDQAIKVLEAQRGPGSRKVSKTEAVLILLAFGMDEFVKQNKLVSKAS